MLAECRWRVAAWQPVERHVWRLIKILNENATAEIVTGSLRRHRVWMWLKLRLWLELYLWLFVVVMGMGLGEFMARRDHSARSGICVCVLVYNMSGTGAISATLMRGER